jgi:ribonuclease HI
MIRKEATVVTCSDGSTIPNSSVPSGAAIVYMDDSITRRELMRDGKGPKHTRWQEETNNNHIAELAAIMMAIRSIPITIPLLHYTDSQASIDGIRNILMDPGEADLRTPARPYLNAIKDSIRVRNKHGASTVIKHVRSHTGHRDIQSIGNELADGFAKIAMRSQTAQKPLIQAEHYEPPYMIRKITRGKDEEGNITTELTTCTGNIRKLIKKQLEEERIKKWAARKARGLFVRTAGREVRNIIKDTWKNPSSEKIR